MNKRVLVNIIFFLLVLYTYSYFEEVSEEDPLFSVIWGLEVDGRVEKVSFISNKTLAVVVSQPYIPVKWDNYVVKNGSIFVVNLEGEILKNISLLPIIQDVDISGEFIIVGGYGILPPEESSSTVTLKPSYLALYSTNGSQLWKREMEPLQVSVAGDVVVASASDKDRGPPKVYVFNSNGDLLWESCGYKVATNGEVIGIAYGRNISIFTKDGDLVMKLELISDPVNGVYLTKNQDIAITSYLMGNMDKPKLRMFDKDGRLRWMKAFEGPIIRTAFTSDGKLIAVFDGKLRIFDKNGGLLWVEPYNSSIFLNTFAFSPDGRLIVYADYSYIRLIVNPLFDIDKDKILDDEDLIPIHNGLFWRVLLTIIFGVFAAWVNWKEKKRGREKARKAYLELKETFGKTKED
ncbi:hypothetical protein E3E22_05235 [Thermococcus sp. MV5]|uniref:hypothetical protein n=1 Tax=Thermococcus sp. MV5 TaxID=1638272 RepID=UPI00143A5DFD|nr:hypothetical protein [Thermococcus sp. MV5]NJE26030.1 hypothetical protein [Thermococcus sp. MV5]